MQKKKKKIHQSEKRKTSLQLLLKKPKLQHFRQYRFPLKTGVNNYSRLKKANKDFIRF